jgi:hypothetical protein
MDKDEIPFPTSATVVEIRRILNINRCRVNDSERPIAGVDGTTVLYVKSVDKVSEIFIPQAYGFHFRRFSTEINYLLDNFSRIKVHKCAALYLVRVLAAAVKEIRAAQPHVSHTWRSQVLHPVLWRAYLGFQHSHSQRASFHNYCAANGIDCQDDPLELGELLFSFFNEWILI